MAAIDFGTHNYIGFRQCGCAVAVVADMPAYKSDTAETVAEMIRDGMDVRRVTHAECREQFRTLPDCPEHGKKTVGGSK